MSKIPDFFNKSGTDKTKDIGTTTIRNMHSQTDTEAGDKNERSQSPLEQ